jgi:Fe-Mn family superoxide dismutase
VGRHPTRDFSSLSGLAGIPDGLIRSHLTHYQGNVRIVNLLGERLADDPESPLEWSELQRRARFEENGLRLHELYFENLSPGRSAPGAVLRQAIEHTWRSFDTWRNGFLALGSIRGPGWVVLYQDSVTGSLFNQRIDLHGEGDPAAASPLLVMDAWDHAYEGMDLESYVDAFLSNIDWSLVASRLTVGKSAGRGAAGPTGPKIRRRRPMTRVPSRSSLADPAP